MKHSNHFASAPPSHRAFALVLGVVAWGLAPGAAHSNVVGTAPVRVELLLKTDPTFTPPGEVGYVSPKLPELWLTALARDEVDLKLQAARAFVEAREAGLNPDERVIAALRRELIAQNQLPTVRLQMANALIGLDAQSTAADLFVQSQSRGLDMQLIVEPALARWKFTPIYDVWRTRLTDGQTLRRELGLAITGLTFVQDQSSSKRLAEIAADATRTSDVRLQAAQAAGELQSVGFEQEAAALMKRPSSQSMIERLCAASLLRHHTSTEAQALLLQLAEDVEPAIAAIALEQLLAIDPVLATPLDERIVAHRDTKIRLLAVALLDGQATPASAKLLAPLLDDVHPGVRSGAREALIRLAEVGELSPVVREATMSMLQSDKVRGLEQAAIVLGEIDHEPSAERLVVLLHHPQPRVFIAAAWALRKIAVLETAPKILAKLHRETEASLVLQKEIEALYKRQEPLPDMSAWEHVYLQLSHLIEALGVMQYRAALPELERYFPKPPLVGLTDPPPVATTRQYPVRAAVVESLGLMFADEPRDDLVKYVTGRLSDEQPDHAESTDVRAASAIALARMNAKSEVRTIERFFKPEIVYNELAHACSWALAHLDGRALYEPPLVRVRKFGWFLEPIDE